ncbi:MAG: type IX secretion system membrane protein PorP/SprF [Bacteroidota bacterium]
MNRIFTSVLILLGFLSISNVKAQQDVQVSHNMFNHMAINPGYAGANDAICATMIGRNQWMGFTGAPKTYLFSIDAPLRILGNSGIGLNVMSDELGFEKNTGVRLSFAKKLVVGSGTLGIGLQGALLSKSYDFGKFKPIEQGDVLLSSTAVEQDMMFDMGFGLYYRIPSKLYVGLSSSQLLETTGSYGNSALKSNPQLARHYYFTAGYYYPLNADIELQPSILIKTELASTQFDFNALALYKQRFWGGLTYRTQDALAVMLGLQPFASGAMKNLKIGFAYDLTTSAIGRNGSSGSLELMLNYCFKIERIIVPSSYRTVRFG